MFLQWHPRDDLNVWCTGLHQEFLQRMWVEEDEDALYALYDQD